MTGTQCAYRIEARVVEPYVSAWDVLHEPDDGCAGGSQWVDVPTEARGYKIQVYVRFLNSAHTLNIDLGVVPPAQRGFRPSGFGTEYRTEMVLWSGATPAVDSPLLLVEGVDADNVNFPSHYYGLAPSFLTTGRTRGADVFILNCHDGGDDLRTNASVLESAILFLNQFNSGARALDLVGLSMGGVVSRYALADMEDRNVDHHVSRFVSVDAPQQGAVIDADLQRWIRDDRPGSVEVPANIISQAGKQLLTYNAFDESAPTERQRFFTELNGLNGDGYPHETIENVGVTFGTVQANPNTGQVWLEADVPMAHATFSISPQQDIAVAGSFLPEEATDVWGQWFLTGEFRRHTNPTFIPYVSALDMSEGVSRFTKPLLVPEKPGAHDEFPPDLVAPLLDRLGYPEVPPPPVRVEGPGTVYSGETGRWRAYAAFGSGAPTYRWEYRLVSETCCVGAARQRRGRPGDVGTTEVPVNQWHFGGTAETFSRRVNGAADLEVKVRVTRGGTSHTETRTVRFTNDPAYATVPSAGPGGAAPGPAASARQGALEELAVRLVLAPTPTREQTAAIVSNPDPAQVTVSMYDGLGRQVLQSRPVDLAPGTHRVPIDVSDLPPGLYLVRATSDTGLLFPTATLTVIR